MPKVIKRETQEAIIKCLTDGVSVRATERITDVHRDTILRIMLRVGEGCRRLLDREMVNLPSKRIQIDEIWGFIGKKQRQKTQDDPHEMGDIWTFVALDPETKIVPTFVCGKRTLENAKYFLHDLAGRLTNRIQLSSDAMRGYVEAAEEVWGYDVDYGQIVKVFESEPANSSRYSPPKVVDVKKSVITGHPAEWEISTSLVERQNLNMRMNMRRLTRLTNGFSKLAENHEAATALHFGAYNFVRIHGTVRMTPAMAAGVTSRLWSIGDLIEAANARY